MSEISFHELIGAIAAVISIPMLVFFFMFKNLKDDVRRQIAAGTEEHEEFRQWLKQHDEKFLQVYKDFGALRGDLGEMKGALGEINSKLDILAGGKNPTLKAE